MTASPGPEHWMQLALAEARLAAQNHEVPVGAVLVKDGQLIASARNAPLAHHDPTAHAEILALRAAAQVLGNYRLEGCEMYVTLEPCPMCAGAMLHARLKRVVFGAADPKTGAAGSVINLFEEPSLNHRTQILGGVHAQASAEILRSFFKPRRLNASPLRQDALRTPEVHFADLGLPNHLSCYTSHLPSLQGLRLHWLDGRKMASSQIQEGQVGQGAPRLALHGPDDWSLRYLSELQAGQEVIAVDLPGFGLSDKPKREQAHTLGWHAKVLTEWIHHLDLHLSGQALVLMAPLQMQDLVRELVKQCEMPLSVNWDLRPALSSSQASAPYPDKGHMAGPSALRALLDN